jgi:hypothetical protein
MALRMDTAIHSVLTFTPTCATVIASGYHTHANRTKHTTQDLTSTHLADSVGAETDGAQLVQLGLHVVGDVEHLEVAAAQAALAVETLWRQVCKAESVSRAYDHAMIIYFTPIQQKLAKTTDA